MPYKTNVNFDDVNRAYHDIINDAGLPDYKSAEEPDKERILLSGLTLILAEIRWISMQLMH